MNSTNMPTTSAVANTNANASADNDNNTLDVVRTARMEAHLEYFRVGADSTRVWGAKMLWTFYLSAFAFTDVCRWKVDSDVPCNIRGEGDERTRHDLVLSYLPDRTSDKFTAMCVVVSDSRRGPRTGTAARELEADVKRRAAIQMHGLYGPPAVCIMAVIGSRYRLWLALAGNFELVKVFPYGKSDRPESYVEMAETRADLSYWMAYITHHPRPDVLTTCDVQVRAKEWLLARAPPVSTSWEQLIQVTGVGEDGVQVVFANGATGNLPRGCKLGRENNQLRYIYEDDFRRYISEHWPVQWDE